MARDSCDPPSVVAGVLRAEYGRSASMSFEILDRALVLERVLARWKGAQIAALAGLRVLLARVEAVLAGGKLADHGVSCIRIKLPNSSWCRPGRTDHWVR